MYRDPYFYVDTALEGVEFAENGLRQTGRTTRELNSLQDDDIYVVHNRSMKDFVICYLGEIGKHKTRVIVCDPHQHPDQWHALRGTTYGKIVFDHVWWFERTRYNINQLKNDVDHIEHYYNRKGQE